MLRLFSRLKEYEIYDNSLIIIVSDHGHFYGTADHLVDFDDFSDGWKKNGNSRTVNMYNSVLFVKPPCANGIAQITHDPAWAGDVRNIVNYYFNRFENISPQKVEYEIRTAKPNVGVMFALSNNIYTTSLEHQLVSVSTLYDILPAFAAKSGISE
jgi:hypothetical protein